MSEENATVLPGSYVPPTAKCGSQRVPPPELPSLIGALEVNRSSQPMSEETVLVLPGSYVPPTAKCRGQRGPPLERPGPFTVPPRKRPSLITTPLRVLPPKRPALPVSDALGEAAPVSHAVGGEVPPVSDALVGEARPVVDASGEARPVLGTIGEEAIDDESPSDQFERLLPRILAGEFGPPDKVIRWFHLEIDLYKYRALYNAANAAAMAAPKNQLEMLVAARRRVCQRQ